MQRNTESPSLSELAPSTGIPDSAAAPRTPDIAAVRRDGAPACAADQSASATLLNPVGLDLSSNLNLDELAWLPPIEQYRWYRDNDAVYRQYRAWLPETLLPHGLMAKYRERVQVAEEAGQEPSISPDLVLLYDGLGKERWDALRLVQRVKELGSREEPRPFVKEDMYEYLAVKNRRQRRYKDIMWLDNHWSRCIAFEVEHGIVDEERVKQRFKRFPFGVFPTLAERNEAERRAEEGGK